MILLFVTRLSNKTNNKKKNKNQISNENDFSIVKLSLENSCATKFRTMAHTQIIIQIEWISFNKI